MANVVEHRKFVFARGRINSNKCWEILLYDNDDVEVRFGRVGSNMQKKIHTGAGRNEMNKLIKSKTTPKDHYDGGCYREVQTLDALGVSSGNIGAKSASTVELKSIATTQIATCQITRKMVEFITEVNAHNIHQATGGRITYDTSAGTFKTPIGIVTSDNIDQARRVLDEITKAIHKNKFGHRYDEMVEELLMLIPQAVPRKFVPQEFIGNIQDVQKQSDILDGLAASVQAVMTVPEGKKKTAPPKLFDVRLTVVDDPNSIGTIQKFYDKGKKRGHQSYRLRMKHVYAIDMPVMEKAWGNDGAKMDNIWKLWHGTKASNLLSILKSGYYIPPATASHVCGRAYGNGVYFSDSSTKSLNYAMNYWSGRDEGRYFMLYNLVAMGRIHVATHLFSGGARPGTDSTWDKGDGEGVFQNTEMIVYRTSQILPTHLIEFV
jgi:poly [ADP-ribose] polymerase